MEFEEILEGLSYNEKRLLLALADRNGTATPADMIADGKFSLEVEIMGAASWLESKGLAHIEEQSDKFYVLEDAAIIDVGLPERVAIRVIDAAGGNMTMEALADAMPGGADKIAVGWLKRKGLADIVKDGDSKCLVLTDAGKAALAGKYRTCPSVRKLASSALKTTLSSVRPE